MTLLPRTIFAAAALTALPALADTTPAPGCWSGTVSKSDGTPDFSVQLWLADADGRLGGTLHFGSPRACQLDARYKGEAGGSLSFSLTRPNGGSCTALNDGTLSVTPGNGDIAFTIAGQPMRGVLRLDTRPTEVKSCLTQ